MQETDYRKYLPGKEKARANYFRIKYTEDLEVKAWMEEKDRNYLDRLEREKNERELTEQEQADLLSKQPKESLASSIATNEALLVAKQGIFPTPQSQSKPDTQPEIQSDSSDTKLFTS